MGFSEGMCDGAVLFSLLMEYTHKDYLSFQKKGVGETNILQQIL